MAVSRWQEVVVNEEGEVLPNATIEVRRESLGSPLATLYSDRDGVTPQANPFVTGPDGFGSFHALGGLLRIKLTKGAYTREYRYVPIGTATEYDFEDLVEAVVDSGLDDIFQARTTRLDNFSALTLANNQFPYATGADTWAAAALTAFARTLLDDADAATMRATLGLIIGTHIQAFSSILQNTTAPFLTAQETKINHIAVTAATDLDSIRTKAGYLTVTSATDLDFIRSRVNDLDQAVILRGGWAANAGTFPGSGTAKAGDSWQVTTAGTVDGVQFSINDRVIAIIDNASTSTYASNWLRADYSDLVSSVAGKTGSVTLVIDDITDANSSGKLIVQNANSNGADIAQNANADGADIAKNATAAGAAVAKAADNAAIRTLLGLVIGTNVQAHSGILDLLAALGGMSDGDIIYYDDGAFHRLGAGAPGQILQTNGGAPPSWVTAGSAPPASDAEDVAFVPAGDITSTNVQDAIEELNSLVNAEFGDLAAVAYSGSADDITAGTLAAARMAATLTPTAIELGHATDTSLTRSAAGRLAVEGKDALLKGQSDTLTTGFRGTSFDIGSGSAITTGTVTPDALNSNFQHYTNGGGHTLAPPTGPCSIVIDVTNNGSAGTITTSGFTKVTGDTRANTNALKYRLFITVGNGGSHIHTQALQ